MCPTEVLAVKPESPRKATSKLVGSGAMLVAWVESTPHSTLDALHGLVCCRSPSRPPVTSDQKAPSGGSVLMSMLAWVVLLIAKATVPARSLIESDQAGWICPVTGPNSTS